MLIIRAAERVDLPALRGMLAAGIREHEGRYPKAFPWLDPEQAALHYGADWERRLGSDETCAVWLAADRDIRGFLAGEVWSRPVGEPPVSFFVEWLYVVPEHRKSGIARALFRELIRFCQRRGIGVAEGRVVPGDTQWSERGYETTAICIKRDLEALARDVAEH